MSTSSESQVDRLPDLLRIPGEIRNQIYTYVLRNETGLHYPDDKAINRIQHVCRQPRSETAWLELKLNRTIKFCGVLKGITATKRFLDFFNSIPPEQRCWLRAVSLENQVQTSDLQEEWLECQSTLILLTTAYKQHQQLSFSYQLAPFQDYEGHQRSDEDPLMLLFGGLMMSRLIRQQIHDPALFPSPTVQYMFEEQVAKAMKEASTTQLHGSSSTVKELRKRIRCYPVQSLLTPDPFQEGVPHGLLTTLGQTQGLLPLWEAIIKRWMKDGF
jgi:hypothetical protein